LRELDDFGFAVSPSTNSDALRRITSEIRQRLLDAIYRLEQKPRAIVERPAVLVGAAIDARREKLLKQITVARVDLDAVVTGLLQAPRRRDEQFLNFGDFATASGRTSSPVFGFFHGEGRPVHIEHRAAQQSAAMVQLREHAQSCA